MKIFSHNTMTYRSPKQWYLKPLFWIARCQAKDYEEQYDAGARCFDLRVRFDYGDMEFSHGIFRYNGDDFWHIADFACSHGIPVRMTLEGKPTSLCIIRFQTVCKKMEDMGINIFGCYCREDSWKVIYQSKTPVPEMVEAYSSKDKHKWNDICPWLWAKCFNETILLYYGLTDQNVMIDFI